MPVLAILAPHPDDEVWAFGALIVAATQRNVAVDVLFATSGEAAQLPLDLASTERPRDALAARRRDEAVKAARVLGVRKTIFAGLPDGALDPQAHFAPVTQHLADANYDAVATFGPDGGYGHRDHVACAQIAARHCAAPGAPSLIWRVFAPEPLGDVRRRLTRWERRMGQTFIDANAPWPGDDDHTGTLVVDARTTRDTVRRALSCHASQLGANGVSGFLGSGTLDRLDAAQHGTHRYSVTRQPLASWMTSLAP